MALQKFRKGESIEAEFSLFTNKTDEAGSKIPVDLSDETILDISAQLYHVKKNRLVKIVTFKKNPQEREKLIQYDADVTSGKVHLVIDPILSESLSKGDYRLEYTLKEDKTGDALYPDNYDIKTFDTTINFSIV